MGTFWWVRGKQIGLGELIRNLGAEAAIKMFDIPGVRYVAWSFSVEPQVVVTFYCYTFKFSNRTRRADLHHDMDFTIQRVLHSFFQDVKDFRMMPRLTVRSEQGEERGYFFDLNFEPSRKTFTGENWPRRRHQYTLSPKELGRLQRRIERRE